MRHCLGKGGAKKTCPTCTETIGNASLRCRCGKCVFALLYSCLCSMGLVPLATCFSRRRYFFFFLQHTRDGYHCARLWACLYSVGANGAIDGEIMDTKVTYFIKVVPQDWCCQKMLCIYQTCGTILPAALGLVAVVVMV